MNSTSWMALEYATFVVHTVLLGFVLGGFHWWNKTQRMFYVHRCFVATVFIVQAGYGQCPITAFERYCRAQHDPSYQSDGAGCIQEATRKIGVEVPDWCIRLGILGVGVKGLVQMAAAAKAFRKEQHDQTELETA